MVDYGLQHDDHYILWLVIMRIERRLIRRDAGRDYLSSRDFDREYERENG